tara:strand:- start:34 stop:405 length:372 start_codon:yes stop_codon:yes gene_type:complete
MSRIENIFYDTIVDDKRYIMTKDKYNWIWVYGNKDVPLENIIKSQTASFYASIESMLVNLLEKRFRNHVVELTSKNFKKALRTAFTEVRQLGNALDQVNWEVLHRGDYCPKCNSKIENNKEKE